MLQKFVPRDLEAAERIIDLYENHCSNCGECPLRAGGWRCTYVYMQSVKYVENDRKRRSASNG